MLGTDMGDVKVEPAVIVIIHKRGAHAGTIRQGTALDRDVLKCSIAVVAVESLPAEVIDYIKVREPVIVEISPYGAQAQTFVTGSSPLRHVGECSIAVVVVKLVRLSIAGVKRCGNVLAWIHVPPHVQIQISVIVIVRPRGHRSAAVFAQARLPGNVCERAVSIVVEQLIGPERPAHKQVFVAVIVVVGKQSDAYSIQT